jgi:hypothetical protein
VSAVFAELRAQGRLQLQAADEQALLQVGVYVGHPMRALARVQRRADHISPLRTTCDTSSLRLLLAPTKQHSAPLPPRIDAADPEMEPGLLYLFLYDLFLGVGATASRQPCVCEPLLFA